MNYKNFKEALRKRDEKNYNELKKEVKTVKSHVERLLTMVFESTASQAKTNYAGLEMF